MRTFGRSVSKISLLAVFVIPVLAGIGLAQNPPNNPCEPFGYTGPVYRVGKDVTAPRIVSTVEPEYTRRQDEQNSRERSFSYSL
jgi:hypothetical protein